MAPHLIGTRSSYKGQQMRAFITFTNTHMRPSPPRTRAHTHSLCLSVCLCLSLSHTHTLSHSQSVEKRTNPNTVGLQQQTKQQQKTRISQGFRDAWLQGQPDNEVPCLHTSDPVMLHQLNWHKLIKTYSGYHSEPFKEGENTLYNRLG